MLLSDIGWVLSLAYDLLNVKIILPNDKEDTALMLGGKKLNFNLLYFDRFAVGLNLNKKQISVVYKRLEKWIPNAIELIKKSFLSIERKNQYIEQIK